MELFLLVFSLVMTTAKAVTIVYRCWACWFWHPVLCCFFLYLFIFNKKKEPSGMLLNYVAVLLPHHGPCETVEDVRSALWSNVCLCISTHLWGTQICPVVKMCYSCHSHLCKIYNLEMAWRQLGKERSRY